MKVSKKMPIATPIRRATHNNKINLNKYYGKVWAGFIWLKTGTSGGIL
jgi:hypothetical protein